MAKLRRPDEPVIGVGGQLSIGGVAAAGASGASIGSAITQSGDFFFEKAKSLNDQLVSQKAISKASIAFNERVQERLGSQFDENGNPLFASTSADVQKIGEEIMSEIGDTIISPDARARFMATFGSQLVTKTMQAGTAARNQQLQFASQGIRSTVNDLIDRATVADIDELNGLEDQFNELINSEGTAGVLDPQQQEEYRKLYRESVLIGRIENRIFQGNEDDLTKIVERLDTLVESGDISAKDSLRLRKSAASRVRQVQAERQRNDNAISARVGADISGAMDRIRQGELITEEAFENLTARTEQAAELLSSPEEKERLMNSLQQVQQFQDAFGIFIRSPENVQKSIIERLRNSGSEEDQKVADDLVDITQDLQAKRKKDPFSHFLQVTGTGEVPPLNIDGAEFKDQLAQRMEMIRGARGLSMFGRDLVPLSTQEVDALNEKFQDSNAIEQMQVLNDLVSVLGQDVFPVMDALEAKGGAELAHVGYLAALGNINGANQILQGRELIKNGNVVVPELRAILTGTAEGATAVPAFANPQQDSAMIDSVRAVYANMLRARGQFASEDPNHIDKKLWQRAVEVATGGTVEIGDNLIIPPKLGMSQDDFEDWVEGITAADIERLGGIYNELGEKMDLDDGDIEDLLTDDDTRWVADSHGRYMLLRRTSNGDLVTVMGAPLEQGGQSIFVLDAPALEDETEDGPTLDEDAFADELSREFQETGQAQLEFEELTEKAKEEQALKHVNISSAGLGSSTIKNMRKASTAVVSTIADVAQSQGIPKDHMLAIANVESAFKPKAANRSSSAKGLYQFINSTWNDMVNKYGAKHGVSRSMVFDPRANALMASELYKENSRMVQAVTGRKMNVREAYIMHFAGQKAGIDIIKNLGKGKKIEDIYKNRRTLSNVVRANPDLRFGMSVDAMFKVMTDKVVR